MNSYHINIVATVLDGLKFNTKNLLSEDLPAVLHLKWRIQVCVVPTKTTNQRTTLQVDTRTMIPFTDPIQLFCLNQTSYFTSVFFGHHLEDEQICSADYLSSRQEGMERGKIWVIVSTDENHKWIFQPTNTAIIL